MTVYWCRVHDSNSENFIARCFYALWANALDRCELREMELGEPPPIEGQASLEVDESRRW